MTRLINSISARLSLRAPQHESLSILARVLELLGTAKDVDLAEALEKIHSEYSSVSDFERDFPSLCFALATGVGKTRLMGAFITYMFLTGRSRHFFVLAPNLTIYDKLITDFSPESPKYVFRGVAEFAANPPVVVTGDNFANGQGVRFDYAKAKKRDTGRLYDTGETVVIQGRLFETEETAFINIFNVSKIDSESRKGNSPKIKRLQEYIGESYFDYLAALPDLVLLMDEAHRYRAIAGAKAINELKPILGLELTATPKTVGTNSQDFKNVIFSYPLGAAMKDGFVKEPAVATRKDFRPEDYTDGELEKIKLEDGIHHHEFVKVELEVYARQQGKALVHPFMLVVAQDTTHSSQLRQLIESEAFFEGRYKGRVIEVHSNLRGEESDEATQRLLSVEHDPETEIVIHVNKLKEGWDVTNLYTIVPLRASASEILTEQTIGRGLRLPYGARTGVESIDRLTIVAHDKFQSIVDAANDPKSIIRKTITIGPGGDISIEKPKVLIVPSVLDSLVAGNESGVASAGAVPSTMFDSPEKREVATVILDVVKQFERLDSSKRLQEPEIKKQIADKVREILKPAQLQIEGVRVGQQADIDAYVDILTKSLCELTIDIPKISVLANEDVVTFGFHDFDLKNLASIRLQPVSQEILIQHLRTNDRSFLTSESSSPSEDRLEDYLIRSLVDHNEIAYEQHSDLLYKVCGQLVAHLKTYLRIEKDVKNILLYHNKSLTSFVFTQMMEHCWETATEFDVTVKKGFTILRPNTFNVRSGERARVLREPLTDRVGIKSMIFTGFTKCCYGVQKFDSDTERRFAIILEDDDSVLRWMKPAFGHLQIELKGGLQYQPDFVVETKTEKFLCESKAASEMETEAVQLKARAAIIWCQHATEHARLHGGKPWSYLLIPHDEVVANRTLDGLKASFALA